MKNNWKISLFVLIIFIFSSGIYWKFFNKKESIKIISPTIKAADSKILSGGMIRSQNEVNLHFQAGGKLVYLPFKEGDRVRRGQTIASLDTYVLQKQLTAALNAYRVTRDNFDQLQDNKENNYLYAQQANPYPYNYFNLGGIGGNDKTNAVNDMIKRLADQSQATLDNSVIQVELANYALSLSSLVAPFDGVITHLDVTSPSVVVSPLNSFMIADPDAIIFRANVSENDINFIAEGVRAAVRLTGSKDKTIAGAVAKIYPDKLSLPTGENVYQVDIDCPDLKNTAMLKQDGVVLIQSKYDHQIILVPSWLILSRKYIWAMKNNQPKLVGITVGDVVGDYIEVTGGLSANDKLIITPAAVAGQNYSIL